MIIQDAMMLRDQFRSDLGVQADLVYWLDYFARLCAANAMVSGFHEDELRLKVMIENALFDDEQGINTHTVDKALEWADSCVLQAELARQMSEIGEAVEAVRKPRMDDHCPDFSNFLVEEADVMIRIGDTVGKREMPIGSAVVAKLLYNMNRPRKHGKGS